MRGERAPKGDWSLEDLTAETLPLLGGALCLDFSNTVDWRGSNWRHDRLQSYDDLIAWARHTDALGPALARGLSRAARRDPERARAALRRARRLRAAIYELGAAVARGGKAPAPALDGLNGALAPLLGRTRLAADLAPAWAGPAAAPERVLWPVAWSAYELFTGDRLARLRECADAECHWLFLDRSRNGSRRWCAMSNCGNLAKARRHRRRHR